MRKQLDHLSLVKITGNDAQPFLQGQLSNDINKLDNVWHYSGYCSPKGRLIALMHIWRTANAIYALLDSSSTDSTIKRLRMYVMRSDVIIEHSKNAKIIGLNNVKALQALAPELAHNLAKTGTTMSHAQRDSGVLFALATPTAASSTLGLPAEERVILIDLQASDQSDSYNETLSSQQWIAKDIDSGLPHITSNTHELFIPQMLNLDVLDGISFKKGCYTGQEIIARMHYLGKLKQRMFVCELKSPNKLIGPGDKVYCDAELSKAVGNLVVTADNHDRVLAVLRLDQLEKGLDLFLDAHTKITPLTDQPYEVPK